MEEFLHQYGLWAVFLGSLVERDGIFLLSGSFAHAKIHSLPVIVAVATSGAFLADIFQFTLGRTGSKFAKRFKAYNRISIRLTSLSERFGPFAIFFSQFLYGLRSTSMLFWGMSGVPWKRFLVTDLIGCTSLAILLIGTGFYGSHIVEQFLGGIRGSENWVIGFFVGITVLVGIIHVLVRRHRRRFALEKIQKEEGSSEDDSVS